MKAFLTILVICMASVTNAQLPTGEVIDTIRCKHDQTQTYALYLPSQYNEDKHWPAVYVFEPVGRGRLPVEKYHSVAEELGFILICSNNSRNGAWDLGFTAADAMFLDSQNRLKIDVNEVYTSGFSGGSRLALAIAVVTGQIKGVIAVGAVQPTPREYQMKSTSGFNYVGLVGNQDMNYQEHKIFASKLYEWEKDNLLLISALDHRWASATDFKIAMLWMFYKNDFKDSRYLSELEQSLVEKRVLLNDSIAQIDLIRLERSLNGLKEGPLQEIDKKLLKEESKIRNEELKIRKQIKDSLNVAFAEPMVKEHVRWVVRRTKTLQNQLSKSKDRDKKLMLSRVLGFVRASSFETSMRLIDQGQYQRALVGIEIWREMSMNPVYTYWWFAKIYALKGDNENSLKYLSMMVDEGFSNKKLLLQEPAFNRLSQLPNFVEILGRMKSESEN